MINYVYEKYLYICVCYICYTIYVRISIFNNQQSTLPFALYKALYRAKESEAHWIEYNAGKFVRSLEKSGFTTSTRSFT